jgi:hypothetical protein
VCIHATEFPSLLVGILSLEGLFQHLLVRVWNCGCLLLRRATFLHAGSEPMPRWITWKHRRLKTTLATLARTYQYVDMLMVHQPAYIPLLPPPERFCLSSLVAEYPASSESLAPHHLIPYGGPCCSGCRRQCCSVY